MRTVALPLAHRLREAVALKRAPDTAKADFIALITYFQMDEVGAATTAIALGDNGGDYLWRERVRWLQRCRRQGGYMGIPG